MSKDLNVLNVFPTGWNDIMKDTRYIDQLKNKVYLALRNDKPKEMSLGIFRNEQEWELMYNRLKDKIEKAVTDLHSKIRINQPGHYIKDIEAVILTKSNCYMKIGIDDNLIEELEHSCAKIHQLESKIDTLAFMVESLYKANLIMRETLEQHQIPLSEDLSFLVNDSITTDETITLVGEDIIYDEGLSS